MGCSNCRWRTELQRYWQDASGGGKQQISLSSHRLDLDAGADIVGLLIRLLSNWVASPPRGWNAEGWIVYLCEGESRSEANPHTASLCVTAWIKQSGSSRMPSPTGHIQCPRGAPDPALPVLPQPGTCPAAPTMALELAWFHSQPCTKQSTAIPPALPN